MILAPRRLALLAVIVFVVAIVFLQTSQFGADEPKVRLPGLGGQAQSDENKGGAQVDVGGGRVERPSEEGLKIPVEGNKDPSTSAVFLEDTLAPQASLSSASSVPWHSPSPSQASTRLDIASTSNPSPATGIPNKLEASLGPWIPPQINGHWPPYDWYADKDYDPNRWEGFDWDNDFYINNGIKKLASEHPAAATPTPYLPYPAYNSLEWQQVWRGEYVACEGARGKRLNESTEDVVLAYSAVPEGFPNIAIGDANATGIDTEHCFDRYHRFGPYGFGQGERGQVDGWQRPVVKPDWTSVPWGKLQDQCLMENKNRYRPIARQPVKLQPGKAFPTSVPQAPEDEMSQPLDLSYHARTALLIRTWEGYKYTDNDLEALRALITELSLLSGGEYQVFLFVNIKDPNADFYSNEKVYHDLLQANVPKEFWDIAILWSEKIFQEWYSEVKDWQVYWHQFMPLQWFSKTHPEFDYVWNWETDARFTGNHYEFLESVAEFSSKAPRKYMWERNSRFYFPSAHGTWDEWLNSTHATIEDARQQETLDPVWGPRPYKEELQKPIGPQPPRRMAEDDFEWGVGEEADLITLQPIWDPVGTEWTFRDKIWNFLPGIRPHFTPEDPIDDAFTHPDFVDIPRRTYINTLSRFSKTLLHAMHLENRAGRTTQAEMWPATVALHHGLKAVYAPHPIWVDRRWPAWYMDAVFNADGGQSARWGGGRDSVYNHDREHNFAGWSWYYQSSFPSTLYRRWLGWSSSVGPERQFPNNPLRESGGPSFELNATTVHIPGRTPDGSQAAPPGGSSFGGSEVRVGGWGRMCLPAMLLHPVKRVFEGAEDEAAR